MNTTVQRGLLLSPEFKQSFRKLCEVQGFDPATKIMLKKATVQLNDDLTKMYEVLRGFGNDVETAKVYLKELHAVEHFETISMDKVINELTAQDLIILDLFLDEKA